MLTVFLLCVCVCVRFQEAWELCKVLQCPESWAEMGRTCLHHIEVELAVQVYRMMGNVGMVMSLEDIKVSVYLSPLRL